MLGELNTKFNVTTNTKIKLGDLFYNNIWCTDPYK